MAEPWVLKNQLRPLVGKNNIFLSDRHDLYFFGRQHLQPSYEGAGDFLVQSSCNKIGLVMGNDNPEYLVWVVLKNRFPEGFLLGQINVTNESNSLAEQPPYKSFEPCRILVIGRKYSPQIFYNDRVFQKEWDSEYILVYKPMDLE